MEFSSIESSRGIWLDPWRCSQLYAEKESDKYYWPQPALSRAPSRAQAKLLAELVVHFRPEFRDPSKLADRLGIDIFYESFDETEAGIEALLVPRRDGGFEIICDTKMDDGDESRLQFRVAHELAHTLFYDLDTVPHQSKINMGQERAVEIFCNNFARELLNY